MFFVDDGFFCASESRKWSTELKAFQKKTSFRENKMNYRLEIGSFFLVKVNQVSFSFDKNLVR